MLGKRLVEVETNVRPFADHHGDWMRDMVGPAVASAAQVLAAKHRRIYVPIEIRLGGTPNSWRASTNEFTDQLWSTEALEIVAHGERLTRLEKIEAIGGHEPVRRALRVCWENRRGAYNCGECSKCVRNIAMLRAYGHLDHVRTFDQPLPLDRLAREPLFIRRGRLRRRPMRRELRLLMQQNLDVAERNGPDPELVRALRECVDERHFRGLSYQTRRIVGRARRLKRAILKV